MRCRHVWKVFETTIERTPWESLVAASREIKLERFGSEMFTRHVIVKRKCETCGTEDVQVQVAS